eukprot:TRINITY_DN15900_c0_g2_i1.p1 TRINITY_DN15900_c0_g2~~TRINITY_DN15900_c0_g2_i1.p1  ORF type:complete len:259 (-),score=51.09 TRINITY_DN15900_c0_g2_i1:336-1112(-)
MEYVDVVSFLKVLVLEHGKLEGTNLLDAYTSVGLVIKAFHNFVNGTFDCARDVIFTTDLLAEAENTSIRSRLRQVLSPPPVSRVPAPQLPISSSRGRSVPQASRIQDSIRSSQPPQRPSRCPFEYTSIITRTFANCKEEEVGTDKTLPPQSPPLSPPLSPSSLPSSRLPQLKMSLFQSPRTGTTSDSIQHQVDGMKTTVGSKIQLEDVTGGPTITPAAAGAATGEPTEGTEVQFTIELHENGLSISNQRHVIDHVPIT